VPIDKFSHLAITFKGLDAVRLYLNGDLIGFTGDVPMRMNGANRVNLQLGNRGDGYRGRYFEGLVDDFRIYRVALTGTMLRRLFDPQHPSAGGAAAPAAQRIEMSPQRAEQ
jgi:hypothetical protein